MMDVRVYVLINFKQSVYDPVLFYFTYKLN